MEDVLWNIVLSRFSVLDRHHKSNMKKCAERKVVKN